MLFHEPAKVLTQLEKWGIISSMVAGGGAALAAVASWWSIYSTNKIRKEEKDKIKPSLQFISLDVISKEATCDYRFKFYNSKHTSLNHIEYIIFFIYPNDHDYFNTYTKKSLFLSSKSPEGKDYELIEIFGNTQHLPEHGSKFIIMSRCTDIYGNPGESITTITYSDNRDHLSHLESVRLQSNIERVTFFNTMEWQSTSAYTTFTPSIDSTTRLKIFYKFNIVDLQASLHYITDKTLISKIQFALLKTKIKKSLYRIFLFHK